MAYQIIWEKAAGNLRGALPTVTQGGTYEVITILALYRDGTGVSLTGKTITATATDEAGNTTSITGTLTGGASQFTWALSEGDIGTDGIYTLIVTYTDGVKSWASDPARFTVLPNPAADAVQNPALVGIGADDAAWVAAGSAGGALGDAAYQDADAFEEALGNPATTGYLLSSTDGGTRSWIAPPTATDRVAKTGDTMTGDLSMSMADIVMAGSDTGGVLSRPYLEFQSPGALVEGLWRQQQVTIGAEKYDNSLRWTYNSAWNAATTNDSRLIEGEHTILCGLESRWTSGGDPETMRGQVEWYLRISPATTGAIANHEAFAVLYDMDNERSAVHFGSTLDTNNTLLLNNGAMRIIGANTIDGGYGLKVDNLPIWAYGGLAISGAPFTIEGVYGGGGSSIYAQWIKSQVYPTTAGSVAFIRVGDGKFGYDAENIATAIGIWVHGNSITKNTSGTLTRTSSLTLTRPTVGAGNAALTFGNGNDVANPGFANYNIYQINTDPNYFAGMVRAASFGAGNLAANTATPSGATKFAMPIYNASGTLQGYIPVYEAAWT